MTETKHIPVMIDEVIEYLDPQSGQNFIDCTLGGGGHTRAIIERIRPDGKLLAIDSDKKAVENFLEHVEDFKLRDSLVVVNDNFSNLKNIYEKYFKGKTIDGILMDLGWSSDQLADMDRGLSFQGEQPLDMRLGQGKLTAAEILNTYTQDELFEIFITYGEESPKFARRLAKQITKIRKNLPRLYVGASSGFKTTKDLVDLVLQIRPKSGRIHSATKVFQALRIEVNNELEILKETLPHALSILKPGGRLAVISFHGLEDKIIKEFVRQNIKREVPGLKLVTKKSVRPSWEEVKNNPRSRSARIRVVERL